MAEMLEIHASRIHEGKYQTRAGINEEHVADLAESIKRIGLVEAISVVPEGDDYVIVSGHHRYRACVSAGLGLVRVIVEDGHTGQERERAFVANFFRSDLSPVETAAAIADIYKSGELTVEEIAQGVNRSAGWVQDMISLLGWPDDVLQALHLREIKITAAGFLAEIDDDVYRGFLLKQAVENGITARTASSWLQAFRSRVPAEETTQIEAPPVEPGGEAVCPSAPCFICRELVRTDGLSRVFLCQTCAGQVSSVGAQPAT